MPVISLIFAHYPNNFILLFFFQLRLMYECNPMAFLVSQAGGMATNGKIDILDIVPKEIHERAPIVIGSTEDVKDYLTFVKK